MLTPPDDERCRATTEGGMVRGAHWWPPTRCSHQARENGYRWLHQPEHVRCAESRDTARGDADA